MRIADRTTSRPWSTEGEVEAALRAGALDREVDASEEERRSSLGFEPHGMRRATDGVHRLSGSHHCAGAEPSASSRCSRAWPRR